MVQPGETDPNTDSQDDAYARRIEGVRQRLSASAVALRAALEAQAFQALARQLRDAEGVLYRPDDDTAHGSSANAYVKRGPTLRELYKQLQSRKKAESQQPKNINPDADGPELGGQE